MLVTREADLEVHRYVCVYILRVLTAVIYGNSSGQDVRELGLFMVPLILAAFWTDLFFL